MKIRLAEIIQDTEKAVITLWHVSENDRVTSGQDLLEIATDKATFDIAAPCDGVLASIMKKEGEEITADEVIAELREDGS